MSSSKPKLYETCGILGVGRTTCDATTVSDAEKCYSSCNWYWGGTKATKSEAATFLASQSTATALSSLPKAFAAAASVVKQTSLTKASVTPLAVDPSYSDPTPPVTTPTPAEPSTLATKPNTKVVAPATPAIPLSNALASVASKIKQTVQASAPSVPEPVAESLQVAPVSVPDSAASSATKHTEYFSLRDADGKCLVPGGGHWLKDIVSCTTIQECADRCSARGDCNGFGYGGAKCPTDPNKKECNLQGRKYCDVNKSWHWHGFTPP